MDSEKFLYFMNRTEQDLNHIRGRVDKLWDFRLLLIGGSIAVSTICSIVVSLVTLYLKN